MRETFTRHSDSIVSKRTVDSNFVPDRVAYELVKEVYECFGLAPHIRFLLLMKTAISFYSRYLVFMKQLFG